MLYVDSRVCRMDELVSSSRHCDCTQFQLTRNFVCQCQGTIFNPHFFASMNAQLPVADSDLWCIIRIRHILSTSTMYVMFVMPKEFCWCQNVIKKLLIWMPKTSSPSFVCLFVANCKNETFYYSIFFHFRALVYDLYSRSPHEKFRRHISLESLNELEISFVPNLLIHKMSWSSKLTL